MFLILAWIALTRCLFLARWAMANALAYLSVCLICSLSPFEAVALSFKPKSIPTLPVPHDCLGYDHVHLLVVYPPKVAISSLVNSLKGVSSRLLRKKEYPSIKQQLRGDALWSPSYFAGSCGGAPIEIIRQYIEQQNTPH
ncbi:hypothetical protein ENHY17A_100287 [Moraxellaceae bacterium 17A]|nr:hypothetical protein ENHY17A_100287 [Moraxellaceae bacterium 17A]